VSENQGCNAIDRAGENDGSLQPNCASNDNPNWVSGVINSALEFDGVNDAIEIPAHESLRPEHLSVAAWVNPNSLSKWDTVIQYASSTSWQNGYGIYYHPNNGINFYVSQYGNSIATIIPLNTWTHLAASYNGSEMKLYANGQLVDSKTYSSSINYSGLDTVPLRIGRGAGGNNSYVWDGKIDEVSFFDRALNPSEIQQLYTSTSPANASLEADFFVNVHQGNAPLSAQFTDNSIVISTNIASWAWDFNNDGIIDSTIQNPSHSYTSPGVYAVSLTISDGGLSSTKRKMALISVEN